MQEEFQARSLFVCSFFSFCPAPISRTCCSPKARRNIVLCAHRVEICLVLARQGNICIYFSAPLPCRARSGHLWALGLWWALLRGAPGPAPCSQVLLWVERRGKFQTTPLLSPLLVTACMSRALDTTLIPLRRWENHCLASVQELPGRSPEVSRENQFIIGTKVFWLSDWNWVGSYSLNSYIPSLFSAPVCTTHTRASCTLNSSEGRADVALCSAWRADQHRDYRLWKSRVSLDNITVCSDQPCYSSGVTSPSSKPNCWAGENPGGFRKNNSVHFWHQPLIGDIPGAFSKLYVFARERSEGC